MFLSPVVDSQIPRKYELHVFVGLAFSPHSASEKWAGGRGQGAGSLLHSWSLRKMLRWWTSHLFDLFDHDSAALSSSFFLPPNAGWCLGRVIWNTAVGQQFELGSWRPYGLCSFPRWWANSAVQVCTTGTSLSVKWHAMRAFTGLVSDTPEKHGKTTFRSYPSQYYSNGIGYTMIQLSPNSLQRYSGFLGFLHLPLNLPQCPHRVCRT